MDETALLTALATTLGNAIPTLRVFPNFQAQVNPPCAIIMPGPNVAFKWASMDGATDFDVRIEVLVSYAEDASSVAALQGYISTTGPNSVYAALLAAPRVAGLYDSLLPTGFQKYGLREWAGQQYFGATVPCNILC